MSKPRARTQQQPSEAYLPFTKDTKFLNILSKTLPQLKSWLKLSDNPLYARRVNFTDFQKPVTIKKEIKQEKVDVPIVNTVKIKQEPQEASGIKFLRTNVSTQGHEPSDFIPFRSIANGRTETFELPREASSQDLHAAAEQALGSSVKGPLNLVLVTHRVIPDDNDTKLWALGFRHRENSVLVSSHDIERGDTLKLTYHGKGRNLNGGYTPL